jgi:hypothetical protein
MLHEITQAVPHPDHTVTVTWSDGARAKVSLAPFLEKGGLFETLKDPVYFVKEMRILPGGIGLTWPNEVDFSADGLRQDAFPAEATGEVEEPVTGAWESERKPTPPGHPVP